MSPKPHRGQKDRERRGKRQEGLKKFFSPENCQGSTDPYLFGQAADFQTISFCTSWQWHSLSKVISSEFLEGMKRADWM